MGHSFVFPPLGILFWFKFFSTFKAPPLLVVDFWRSGFCLLIFPPFVVPRFPVQSGPSFPAPRSSLPFSIDGCFECPIVFLTWQFHSPLPPPPPGWSRFDPSIPTRARSFSRAAPGPHWRKPSLWTPKPKGHLSLISVPMLGCSRDGFPLLSGYH